MTIRIPYFNGITEWFDNGYMKGQEPNNFTYVKDKYTINKY